MQALFFSLFLISIQSFGTPVAKLKKSKLEINEFSVPFFTEIYDYIVKLQADATTRPVRFSRKDCRANQKLQKQLLKEKLNEAERRELKETKHACMEAAEPLSRFLQIKPKLPWVTETLQIKRQIEIIAVPMVRAGFPVALSSSENKRMADDIVSKVYVGEIKNSLKQRMRVLVNLSKKFEERPLFKEARRELKTQWAELEKLHKSGLEQASSSGLPYPSLTHSERRFLTVFLSAFMWRARGGGLYKKDKSKIWATQRLRLRYVFFAYQALAELNGWKQRATAVGASMGRRILFGWGDGHDLGVINGTRAGDYQVLLERGVYQTEGLEELLERDGFKTEPMRFAGEHLAYCYVFGWDIMSVKRVGKIGYKHRLRWGQEIEHQKPFTLITKGPITWAEFCWGAALGLGLSKSLLPTP